MENKKTKIISIASIIALALTLVTATYAYFMAQTGEGKSTDIKINANTVDTFTFEAGSALNLSLNQENFASGKGNQTGTTFAKAMLSANNKTNTATEHYYMYLNISENTFTYTQDANTPEILLTIKDGSNNEITTLTGLTYKTVTDGKGASIKGFDITTKKGLVTILNNREITTTSTKTEQWNVTVTFVNYNSNQAGNAGKNFSAKLMIQKEKMPTVLSDVCTSGNNLATCITTLSNKSEPSIVNIYHHTSSLANGAGDNSYRYAGGDYVLTDAGKATGAAEILAYNDDVTSLIDFYCGNTKHFFGYTCGSSDTFYYIVKGDTTHYKTYNEALTVSLARGYLTKDLIKNYVCFDTNESPCPTDNLYRIIGVMGDKVKLIKYDYATKDMLLSNGLYNEDVVASTDAYSSFYKGTLSNISLYYAGSETALAYNLNETKKVQKLSRKNELAVGDPCSGEKIKLNETALGVINLNTNYYGLLSNDSKNKIVNNDWFINSVSANKLANSFTIYTSEYDNSEKTTVYSAYIGLMYLSDYAYANSLNLWATEDYKETINSNWMYMGVQEGVITYFDTCNPYSIRWDGTINSIGYSSPIAIRPTFYLKSDVLYKSGIGTISSPIILKK